MAVEIERKFLVADPSWRTAAEGATPMVQFYLLAEGDRSLRVRIRDGRTASATLKIGEGARRREEFTWPLPLADALALRAHALGRAVEKTRHLAAWRGHVYEIDVFAGPLQGLVVVELETESDVADADLPPWIGREVTDDPRFLNVSLAFAEGGPPS